MSVRRNLISKSCLFPSHRISAIGKVFNWDERWSYFFFSPKNPQLRLPPEQLLSEAACFSHEERILIQIALDLWCEQGNAKISDCLEILDDDAFLRVISALVAFRELTLEDLRPHLGGIDEDRT
ncbi:hypothetical protein WDW86_01105 [Bdellovibrionota bacterium FG-2]